MTADPPITEHDLLAYVDGQLDPPRSRAVERHLANHPEDARRVAADLAIRDGLRRLFGAADRQPLSHRRPAWAGRVMAAALFLALGAGAGWWGGSGPDPDGVQVVTAAVRPPLDGDLLRPAGWSGQQRAVQRPAPNLSAVGFQLVAQASAGTPEQPLWRLIYLDSGGQRVDLYLLPLSPGEAQLRQSQSGGRPVVSWAGRQSAFALTGTIGADRLAQLARLIDAQERQTALKASRY